MGRLIGSNEVAPWEERCRLLSPHHSRSLGMHARAKRVTSYAGLMLDSEILHTSALTTALIVALHESRSPEGIEHSLGRLTCWFVVMFMQARVRKRR